MKNKELRKQNILKAIEDIDNKFRKLWIARGELSSQLSKLENPVQKEQRDPTQKEKEEQSLLDKNKFQEKLTNLQFSGDDPVSKLFFQNKISEEKLQDLPSSH